jgi:hypothetical protein
MVHKDYIVKSSQKISHFLHRSVILVVFEINAPTEKCVIIWHKKFSIDCCIDKWSKNQEQPKYKLVYIISFTCLYHKNAK